MEWEREKLEKVTNFILKTSQSINFHQNTYTPETLTPEYKIFIMNTDITKKTFHHF